MKQRSKTSLFVQEICRATDDVVIVQVISFFISTGTFVVIIITCEAVCKIINFQFLFFKFCAYEHA